MEIGKVCIASWGSYNACNETEATLGVWVDFNDFEVDLYENDKYLTFNKLDISLMLISFLSFVFL